MKHPIKMNDLGVHPYDFGKLHDVVPTGTALRDVRDVDLGGLLVTTIELPRPLGTGESKPWALCGWWTRIPTDRRSNGNTLETEGFCTPWDGSTVWSKYVVPHIDMDPKLWNTRLSGMNFHKFQWFWCSPGVQGFDPYHPYLYGGFHSHGGSPIAGWFISWKILWTWMI